MRTLLLLPLLGLAVWPTGANPVDIYKRIIGGHVCNNNEAKYQVLMTKVDSKVTKICGGSLLHANWVLTAAHCTGLDLTVYTGIPGRKYSKKGQGQKITVTPFDPGFTGSGDPDNDIMLIKLDTAVTGDVVTLPTQAQCKTVNQQAPANPALLLVAGWGRQIYNDPKSKPDDLMCVEIQTGTCPTGYTADQFCAGDANHQAGCGDSGGGLVHKDGNDHIIYGVVSTACEQAGKHVGTIFASVCYHLAWIKKTTGLP